MMDCSVRNMWFFRVRKNISHVSLSLLSFKCKSISATKSPLFFRTTFSASLTNLTVLLPQSRDSSCYVSRPALALSPLWLHTQCYTHKTLRTLTNGHMTLARNRFLRLKLGTLWNYLTKPNCRYASSLSSEFHKAHSCSTKSGNVRLDYVICFEVLSVTCLSQPSVNATFHQRMFFFTSWSHYVCLCHLAYRFLI